MLASYFESMTMESSMSILAFVGTSLVVVTFQMFVAPPQPRPRGSRQQNLLQKIVLSSTGKTNDSVLSKDKVMTLRTKYYSKSVSVSYANSGPLMIVQGHGSRLIDETGISYLDTRNNVAHIGHGHPHVIQAVQKQIGTLNTNTRYLHPLMAQLAEELITKWFPVTGNNVGNHGDDDDHSLQVVMFVNSGSEANDLALRLARAHTRSKNTIVVDGAYHGHTLSTLEVSPYKYEHSKEFDNKLQPPTPTAQFATPGRHIWKVPCPDTYRGLYRNRTTAGVQYASYVQEACQFYTSQGESVGAFIVEGGMSVAGVILPPPDYLRLSVQAVREAGGVYIADEVQTGLGRLGTCAWAFQYDDKEERNNKHHSSANDDNDDDEGNNDKSRPLVPDIVTIGKPFGNGIPLGAVIMTRAVAASFESMGVEYFNTFGGNPVCAAAGLAVLQTIESEQLQRHAYIVGNYLMMKFRTLQERGIHLIGDIRGSGLFVGIELVRDHNTLEPATEETSFICTTLKEKYQILSSIDGLYDNVLVVKPPLAFSQDDVDIFVDCFEKAVTIDLRLMGESNIRNMSKTPT